MSSGMQWADIEAELKSLQSNPTYLPFQPVLERLQTIVNVRYPNTEAAEGLLRTIKELQLRAVHGTSIREQIEQIKNGIFQPGLTANTVNQAARDVIINIFQDVGDRLRLPERDPDVPVPIVLAVMSNTEAQDLQNEGIFAGHPAALHSDYQTLRDTLVAAHLDDWVQRYKPAHKDWQPFGVAEDQPTIGALVEQAINNLNRDEGYSPQLVPYFIDIHSLVENRALLRDLRERGCVLVIDTISMRHPNLQRVFHVAMLDAYPRTSVLTIAPAPETLRTSRNLTIIVQLRVAELEFARRRVDRFEDEGACKEISDMEEFEQWMYGRVRKLGLSTPGRRPSILDHMHRF